MPLNCALARFTFFRWACWKLAACVIEPLLLFDSNALKRDAPDRFAWSKWAPCRLAKLMSTQRRVVSGSVAHCRLALSRFARERFAWTKRSPSSTVLDRSTPDIRAPE